MYVGLFLISIATLILEITLTRLLAVAQWHHFAFFVISIAMLGFGMSGTLLSLFPSLLRRIPGVFLGVVSTVFCVSSIGSFLVINALPFDQCVLLWDPYQLLIVALYYVCLAVPFTASGLCVGYLLSERAGDVGRIYFFTMAGSGLGCGLGVWLAPLGAPQVILLASSLGAGAAILFSVQFAKWRAMLAIGVALVFLLLLFHALPMNITITPYKDLPTQLRFPRTKILSTFWNSFSRIDVIEGPSIRYAPGLSFQFQDTIPPQVGITWDGDGLTGLTKWEGDLGRMAFTDYVTSSAAYHLNPQPKTLVVGLGSGFDLLAALYHGAESVTGVETNPILVDIVTEKYRHITGDLFRQSNVELIVDEGRSYLRRSRTMYNVIQISLLDSQTAASAGAYGLSENYLYTVEAFREYFEHLTPNGIVSITRWLLLPPRDCLRLCAIALTALEDLGIEKPADHIALIRSWGTSTFLMTRSPISLSDVAHLKHFCRQRGFDVVFFPGVREGDVNTFNTLPEPYYYRNINDLVKALNRSAFFADYLLDVRPTTDDRPFFHHFLKWRNIKMLYHTMGKRMESFVLWGDVILMVVLGQAVLFSAVLILFPLRGLRKGRSVGSEKHAPAALLLYFLCLGFGFICVEIVLIQKFILFLGRPVYSLSVVLFSIFLFSGCGSLASRRFGARPVIVLLGLCLIILLYHVSLSPLFHLFLGHPLSIRILFSVALLAPLGIVLGIPFPLGVRILNTISPSSIPWAWGINSCASVVGSIAAVAIALYFGFSTVFVSAGVIYLIGLSMITTVKKHNMSQRVHKFSCNRNP